MAEKSVLITGGAQRIGCAIAKAFGNAGWHVVIHYNSSQQEARALADQLPSAELTQCDLSDGEAGVGMIKHLAERLPEWRVLINNASAFLEDDVTSLDPATNSKVMQINATTPTRMAQAFLKHARSSSGRRVIQMTDQKIANTNPDFFSYSMSKFALDGAAQMMAIANAPEDRVYRLAPGAILASHDQTAQEAEHSHRLNLLKRRTAADEIASAALFMAEGTLATGSELFIDSGQHLLSQPRDVIYLERGES